MSQPSLTDAHWPPKSPHEALLSTPGGRDRLRRLAERVSPSPSPIKRVTSTSSFRNRNKEVLKAEMATEDLTEDEEDEETLELKLQEIQARLKLKKLQKRAKQGSDTENDVTRVCSAPLLRSNSVGMTRTQLRPSALREDQPNRSKSQTSIHVPVSPVRRAKPTEAPRSPGRVLLGIDKGLKGSDVSLRRAPGLRKPREAEFYDTKRVGGFLQRTSSQAGSRTSVARGSSQLSSAQPQPASFNERMAAIRALEMDRQERDARLKKQRSMAFDIDHQQMESFKKAAMDIPETRLPAPEFNRDEVLNSYNQPTSRLSQSKSTPSLRFAMRSSSNTADTTTTRSQASPALEAKGRNKSAKVKLPPSDVAESEASEYEPYSSIHLSKRIVPHRVLTRTFAGKKIFVIPDLLKIITAPDFCTPDTEGDFVVLAIIAKKSDPKTHQPTSKNENRGKFMVMALTDLKWELDLFLFDSAFEKFWKLTPGTIIAILNPTIMPPPRGKVDTGRFSLTLNSSEDTVLEIGSARDLGYCKSIKKDGKPCDTWVDKRHTEFCDYHVNLSLKKTHAGRMEVNTMNFGKGGYGARKLNSKDMTGFMDRRHEAEVSKRTRYDRESHSQIFIGGRSSANLLDDVDFNPDAFHRGTTKEERLTRRLIQKEKEKDLARKLGQVGGGLGANYLRLQDPFEPHPNWPNEISEEPPPDAAALGLLGGGAKDLHLSPVKRKRANNVTSTKAIGWGCNLTKELGRMKNGESLQPVKKKTRFVTEKGIREAGRESFGGEAVKAAVNELNDDDDEDDDLEIIRL